MAVHDFQKAIAEEVATKCIAEVKKKETESKSDTNDSGCSKLPMRAFKCAARALFNACPADLQDTSEKCTKLREMISSGKFHNHSEEQLDTHDD